MNFPYYPGFCHTNNAHLKIGDKVQCLRHIIFLDYSKHAAGDIITVEPETQAYLSLFTAEKGQAAPYHLYEKIL